jgi:L-threonylcarbamoyladenylate synthase
MIKIKIFFIKNQLSLKRKIDLNPWHLQLATRTLRNGGIIAYPTEAVYGLGCDPLDQFAVIRLLKLKRRPWQKGLILIAANYEQLIPFLEPLTPELARKIFAVWPGAITWLLPAKPTTPRWLRGQSERLAVRVTAHPLVIKLCERWGNALVSTSANCSGQPPAKSALQVRKRFPHHIDYIMPGEVGGNPRPSEIRDALTNEVLRV